MLTNALGPEPAWVAVISAGRPANVAAITDHLGPATWYVPTAEAHTYLQAGAPIVVQTGSLADARNAALDDAFEVPAVCVQCDDDLVRVVHMVAGVPMGALVRDALTDMLFRLRLSDFNLAGAAPTNNPYFSRQRTATNLFVLGSLMAVKPSAPRFDPAFLLKEDYDFTIQHYLDAGGVLRCDDWLPTFRHYTNPGGAVTRRSDALEKQMVGLLRQKWGGLVRAHPRRPNEVLLRLPRHKALKGPS